MIAPAPVDLQIGLRDAFIFEPCPFQKRARGDVFGQGRGLDPGQIHADEGMLDHSLHRLAHVALAGMGRPDPVAQRRGAGRAAAHIVERGRAQQRTIGPPDQEQRQRLALALRPHRPEHPRGKGRAGQMIFRPAWLPALQEGRAVAAQRHPGGIIGMARQTQRQPLGLKAGRPRPAQPHQAARRADSAARSGAPATGP
jgi:hypothetical protein